MNNLETAKRLHQESVVVDAHMDLAAIIQLKNNAGETDIIKNYFLDSFRAGGFTFIVSSIYVDAIYPETALRQGLEQVVALKREIAGLPEDLLLVTESRHLDQAVAENKIGILMSFEGVEPISNNLALLDAFYDLGVRGAGLVWSRRNFAADGCISPAHPQGIHGGLTKFGVETVKRLEELNMFIDVSHLNDAGFADVERFTEKPFIASHSDCRALCDTTRNLTDDQIRVITGRGGVVAVNNLTDIAGAEGEMDRGRRVSRLCDHIEHIIEVGGIDGVGFGFDLCDFLMDATPVCGVPEPSDYDIIADHGEAILLTTEMLARGYAGEDLKKLIGGNLLRVYRGFVK